VLGSDSGVTESETAGVRRDIDLVLGVLKAADEPVPIVDLARQAGVDFKTLSVLLLEMQRRGQVSVDGPPGKETVVAARSDG